MTKGRSACRTSIYDNTRGKIQGARRASPEWGTLSLSQTELVHFVRPSADLLFESVAATSKQRAIAVVLTGTGVDGNMGVRAIKKMGGTVIVQDEQTSEFFGMPFAAIQTGCADFILPLDEIPKALLTLVLRGEGE